MTDLYPIRVHSEHSSCRSSFSELSSADVVPRDRNRLAPIAVDADRRSGRPLRLTRCVRDLRLLVGDGLSYSGEVDPSLLQFASSTSRRARGASVRQSVRPRTTSCRFSLDEPALLTSVCLLKRRSIVRGDHAPKNDVRNKPTIRPAACSTPPFDSIGDVEVDGRRTMDVKRGTGVSSARTSDLPRHEWEDR